MRTPIATARPLNAVEPFEDRLETLFSELELAVKYDRPSILLAVYRSEFVRAAAEAALAEKLRGLGQAVVTYRVTGEADADVPMHLAAREDRAAAVYFVSGLQWGGGRDGALAYRSLNIRREYFVDYRIRAVFWLTEQEAAALPRHAPDFWVFRHRAVEFVEQPAPEQAAPLARELAWQGIDDRTLREDTAAKIVLRETLLRDLPETNETLAPRAELLYTLAGLRWANRECAAALDSFQQALDLAEQLGDTRLASWSHNGLGNVYRALGRYDDAIAACQRSIELDPNNAYPHNGLGNVYRDLGRYDDAIAAYQRSIELDPNYAATHALLAACYHKLGRQAEYQAEVEAARKLMATESEYNRACFEAILGHTEEALALLKLALDKRQISVELAARDPDFELIRTDPRFRALVGEREKEDL